MNESFIQEKIRSLCQANSWRSLVDLIEDGYKGMFVILCILHDSKCDVVAGDLAKQMKVSTARVAKALNTLESKNYIKRESEKSDARKVVIRMTQQGEQALSERKKSVDAIIASMFKNLTEEETITLFSLLKKLLQ